MYYVKIVLFLICLGSALCGLAAPHNNDFRKNYIPQEGNFKNKDWQGTSQMYDTSGKKDFSNEKFYQSDSVNRSINKKFDGLDNKGENFTNKDFTNKDLQYSNASKKPENLKKNWDKSENTPNFKNLNEDLNKSYGGNIELEKEYKFKQHIVDQMQHMQENSLAEINKFFSLGKDNDTEGIPVTVANEDALKSSKVRNESLLDILGVSSTKEIQRGSITLKKSADLGTINMSDKDSKSYVEADSQNKLSTKSVQNTQNKSSVSEGDSSKNKQEVVESVSSKIDTSKTKSFFGLPQNMRRGEATIKVDVKKSE